MEKIKIMEWNINQRSGKKDSRYMPFIPEFVWEKIRDIQAHIIILTEFFKVVGWEEKIYTDFPSFEGFVTNNPNNDVLIMVSKDLLPKNSDGCQTEKAYSPKSSYASNCPDYLDIPIRIGEKDVRIIGTRIIVDTKAKYGTPAFTKELKNRHEQGKTVVKRLQELIGAGNLVIGAGDFNTGREKNPDENWSQTVFRNDLKKEGIELYLPKGQSHLGFASPDLFFASEGISVALYPYDWEFVTSDNLIYYDGQLTKNIKSPYPDHGILIAEVDV